MKSRSSSNFAPRRARRRSVWPITLTYVSISVAWIVLSDVAVLGLGSRIDRPILTVSLIKGLFWVASSGLLLHLLVFRRIRQIQEFEASARSRLERRERQLAQSQQIAHLGSYEWDLETQEAFWSDELFRIYGMESFPGPIPPGFARDMVVPDDLPKLDAGIDMARAGRTPSPVSFRIIRRDGAVRVLEARGEPVPGPDGEARLFAGTLQDITERKRIDEERETFARQVRLLLRSTEAGLFAVDLDGRCTLINRAACESLGTSEQETLGRHMQEIVYGGASNVPPETKAAVLRANEGGSTKLYGHRFRRRDGSLLPCDVTISPIAEDGTVIGRAISFVDVSDRMRLEEQIEEAKRLSGLGRLASSIAHEINNVLMGILPFAEIVARSKETSYRNAGEQIRQSVRRGRGVTQEILRFAREEEPHRQVFEGRAWLRSIAAECREIASTKAAWSMTIPEEDFYLDADPSQLGQALINLVMNARDAIESSPGQVALAVDLAEPGRQYSFGALPDSGHRWVAIRVSDNGTGMDADTLQHLFEPFFTKKRGGTGLGLPIAYKTIAAHGGLLFVESAEGDGSTFHIFLPEAEAAPPEHTAEPETGRAVRLAGEVLLVEDDETVAAGLTHVLEEAGMRVRIAPTGADALADLERARPTVMILDIGLPDMDGATVCERALACWPGLPVIFSTGHGEARRLRNFLEKPNVRFLAKPYTFEQLRDEIEAVMGNRK